MLSRTVFHAVMNRLPDGTRVPILTGPLRGYWWHWVHPHYRGGNDPGGGLLGDWGYVAGKYEPHTQALLRRHVKPDTWVWDLGAHHGFFSLLALRLGANVVSIEGDPNSWPWIERNVLRQQNGHVARLFPHYVNVQTDWKQLPEPDLVKCDIDGGESEALLGLLEVYRPRVFVLSTHGPIHALFCKGLLHQSKYTIETIRPDDQVLAIRE